MTRDFVVTAIEGGTDHAAIDDPGPLYVDVIVSAENVAGEQVRLRLPIDQQPKVGDVIPFATVPVGGVWPAKEEQR